MNYHKITYTDVNNGNGCRVTLWIAGCSHHCPGCHNPQTWDFKSGKPFDADAKEKLFKILSLPYIKGHMALHGLHLRRGSTKGH